LHLICLPFPIHQGDPQAEEQIKDRLGFQTWVGRYEFPPTLRPKRRSSSVTIERQTSETMQFKRDSLTQSPQRKRKTLREKQLTKPCLSFG